LTNWAEQLKASKGNARQPEQPAVRWQKPTQQMPENMKWGEVLKSAAVNAPKSAYKYGKDIYTAISHPVETGKALGGFAEGAAQVLAPVEPSDPFTALQGQGVVGGGYEKLAPLVDEMKNRYGSVDNFKRTLANDPAAVLADVASLLVPAGKATGLSKVVKVGSALDPMSIAANAAMLPFKLIPEKLPISLYKSAVKLTTTLSANQRTAVVKTALKYNIMPHAKGMIKLHDSIDVLNKQISDLINIHAKSGDKIHISQLYKGIGKVKKQFQMVTDEPLAWDAAFNKLKKQWKKQFELGEIRTPQQVQKLKQGIYNDLQSYYEKVKATPARVELRKAIARNARETLEILIPEIKHLNETDGALLELMDALESKANRIQNRDLLGIGIPVKMGTGAGVGYMFAGDVGGRVGSQMGLALGIFDTPQVKSKIALVLNNLRTKGVRIRPNLAATNLGLYQTQKLQE